MKHLSHEAIQTIKSYEIPRFKLSLVHVNNGYYIQQTLPNETPTYSERISELKTAFFLYDVKLRELEGN